MESGNDLEQSPLSQDDIPVLSGHLPLEDHADVHGDDCGEALLPDHDDGHDGGDLQATKSGRKRVPTAAALASSEQAQETAPAKAKTRQRKKMADTSGVSRTSHGGVKIGGRAVTWVGGAGIAREVLDKMGIPQLRALFLKTFNHPTGSNNAEWLRKKLAQPQDPQVGAARAAVPRARDVGAEIWTTGTTFKGFTKQERVKLQQMGGNCAAKVVEVIRDQPPANPERQHPIPSRRRRKKPATPESTKMTVIGAETFELPPQKRARSTDDGGTSHSMLYECRPPASQAQSPEPGEPLDSCFADGDAMSMPVASSMPSAMVAMQPWRTLRMADAHLLRTGCNVQVYRADERWHSGVLEKIDYAGSAAEQKMMVTIYYWGHDQSEERPLEEFFRGEQHSLIQWQPPTPISHVGMQVGSMPGVPMQGMPIQAMPMQGMPVAGGMGQVALGQSMSMYMAPGANGDLVTAQPIVNQIGLAVHGM